MKIIPLYRFEQVFLIGLASDLHDGSNLDGLVAKINLSKKKIEVPAWSIQKMLKFGFYYPIKEMERESFYDLIRTEMGMEVIDEIENILLFPSREAIDSLIWIPKRLEITNEK